MRNSYKNQDACANCKYLKTTGGVEEPESFHCTRWLPLIQPISRYTAMRRNLSKDFVANHNQEAQKRSNDTMVMANGICDDYEKFVREPGFRNNSELEDSTF